MRKVCNNCRWFLEKRNYIRRWCYCCSPDIETRKLDCYEIYRLKPDWCPGFTEPPEELPEDMKDIFKPEKEENMSKAEEQLEKLYDYIAENYGSYSRIFYDDVEMAIETMEKQERYNNVLNEKLKELDKELDRLQDYIVENYNNYQRDNFDDIRVDIAIEVIEQHKEYENKLKNMVSNLKDEREKLEDKLTKLSNAYICNMMSQLEIENPESYIKEQVDKMFKTGAVPASYLNTKATTATKSFLEEENMEKFIVYLVGERVCVVEGEEVMFDDTANSYKIGNNEFPRENVIAIVEV